MSTIIDQNNRHRPLDNWRRGLCGSGGIVGGSYGFMRESMPLLASDLNRPVDREIWAARLTLGRRVCIFISVASPIFDIERTV